MTPAEEDRAWADYSSDFRKKALPKLLSSDIFLSIGGSRDDFDVKMATELGATLLMGKPILLLVPPGQTIHAGLRRAADLVLDDFTGAESDHARLDAAMAQLLGDELVDAP